MLYKNLTIFSVSAAVHLLAFSLYIYFNKNTDTIRIVDSNRLFNEFKMTKEIKLNGEQILKKLNSNIDSLYVRHNLLGDEKQKTILVEQIINEKQKIQAFNESYVSNETEKIWARINSYSKDYSNVKDYPIIIGGQNKGDIIFANAENDITLDLLNYINKRYEGYK